MKVNDGSQEEVEMFKGDKNNDSLSDSEEEASILSFNALAHSSTVSSGEKSKSINLSTSTSINGFNSNLF